MSQGEFGLIDWIRRRTAPDRRVLIGPGDDTAALAVTPGQPCLVTVDLLLEGAHFDLRQTTPFAVGRKAMGVNLSDIAAMAGRPTAAVVSVGLPRSGGLALGQALYDGLRAMADAFDTPIIGGDTNSWTGPLCVSVTVLGEPTGTGPVRRDGAQPGDWILVTGSLGGSILGKHLDVRPRVREAIALHAAWDLHAMIDLSDGLAADLGHILDESRCGAVLDAAAIPVSEAARQLAERDGISPLDHALGDGEDFELLFTLPADQGRRLIADAPIDVPIQRIGVVQAGPGMMLETAAGERRPLAARGYVHPLE